MSSAPSSGIAGASATTEPTPGDRIRRPLRGIAVELADGRAWTLSDAAMSRALDGPRDRIFDAVALSGRVALGDVVEAAWLMLLDGYDLSGPEIGSLLAGVPFERLWPAVADAMFGRDDEQMRAAGENPRTYSRWARAALLANGLDPAAIDPRDRPAVLEALMATGRAVEPSRWVESLVAAERRARMLADD